MRNLRLIKRTILWLLLAAILLYAVSGFGITEFRTVENLTHGWLTKNLAFKIHDYLSIPFLVLLISHVGFAYILRRRGRNSRPIRLVSPLIDGGK